MADLPEIASLTAQLRNISGPHDVPWQIFAEMKVARDYRVIQPLIDLFWEHSASQETIEAVKQILADFGAAAVPALISALESPDMETRYLATITLGLIADPRAIEPLILRFKDEEHGVSLEAGIALSKIGKEALPSILKAIFDPDASIRHYSLTASDYFYGPEVKEAILKSLSVENKGALLAAANAAARPDFVEAVPGLIKLLEVLKEDSWDSSLMKAEAARSLGIIGDPSAIDALALALTDKNEFLAEEAAVALGKIGDVRAVPLLVEALGAVESKGVRFSIVGALAQFGDSVKSSILTALKDQNPNIRFGVVMVLGSIGDEKDLAVLEVMAENDSGETFSRAKVKTAAGKAIKRIQANFSSK